jgi:Ca-activated chloride channel family protein
MKAFFEIFAFAVLALFASVVAIVVRLGGSTGDLVWAAPFWWLAAPLPFIVVAVRQWWRPRPATLRFSRVSSLKRLRGGFAARFVHLPDGLRVAAAILLVAALARAQSTRGAERVEHEGIDIVIVLDLSVSMETPDLPPSRLAAAQFVVDDFISRRPRDRIGLVVFGATASTVAPLTMDHGVLRALVGNLRLGVMDGSTTAIGAGLGVALNRLEESEADTQVIVLLTDGVSNAGELDPDDAAAEAAERGISIYTILMGRHHRGAERSVDPAQLERLASVTGGYAYTAVDQDALRGSFQDLLDKLERSRIEGEQIRPERFELFLWPALLLLLLDVLLRNTRLRRFP